MPFACPQLIALSGPRRSTVFPLANAEVLIGRDPSNCIQLEDILVSRQHCSVRSDADGYKLFDRESHNGTFVNDLPIQERALEHGDRIKVGNTLFLFLLHEADDLLDSGAVQVEDGPFNTETAIRLSVEDAHYPAARDLSVLLKISATINALHSPKEIQRKLLEQVLATVPAQRVALLFKDSSPDGFAPGLMLERHNTVDGVVRVSRTVVQQVLRESVALLADDVRATGDLGMAESLIASNVRSLLCVPLITLGKTLGAIYADTNAPSARFDQGHLQLLTAIANVAASVLENALHIEWLEGENRRLRADFDIEHSMIGESPAMCKVYQFISKVAPTDSTVLIMGESGTGKELVARAVHQNSPRTGHPFVAINCATLTETLLESELFGYEKGAFTGALTQRKGKIEAAEGGTLFLDEVGEIAPALQAKLLRFLQEREITRIGGTRPFPVDVRVIAATNQNLRERIAQGDFREDLYFRLNVITLTMPPLRQRQEDIPLLASYFVARYSEKCKRKVTSISSEARSYLVGYDWPGNVREMENAIERAIVLGSTAHILPEDLPEVILESKLSVRDSVESYHEAVNTAKRQIIRDAMKSAGGSYTEAAKLLGIHPNNLHRLINSLKLKDEFSK